jgi:hypothetical protein
LFPQIISFQARPQESLLSFLLHPLKTFDFIHAARSGRGHHSNGTAYFNVLHYLKVSSDFGRVVRYRSLRKGANGRRDIRQSPGFHNAKEESPRAAQKRKLGRTPLRQQRERRERISRHHPPGKSHDGQRQYES